MKRIYINSPTPYLKKHLTTFKLNNKILILDLGCGNLRNTNYVKSLGFNHILSFDKEDKYGIKLDLGSENIPIKLDISKLILCNYEFCFLNNK